MGAPCSFKGKENPQTFSPNQEGAMNDLYQKTKKALRGIDALLGPKKFTHKLAHEEQLWKFVCEIPSPIVLLARKRIHV